MATLQASLLLKPSRSSVQSIFSSSRKILYFSCSLPYSNHNPLPVSSRFISIGFRKPGFFPAISFALQSENANSGPESAAAAEVAAVSGTGEPKAGEFRLESSVSGGELEEKSEFSEADSEGNAAGSEEKGGVLVAETSRMPLMVFLLGVWARVRSGFEKILMWDWLSWWSFWRQEKRLERLIVEADANPMDAAKQNALLAELNKQRLDYVVVLL